MKWICCPQTIEGKELQQYRGVTYSYLHENRTLQVMGDEETEYVYFRLRAATLLRCTERSVVVEGVHPEWGLVLVVFYTV